MPSESPERTTVAVPISSLRNQGTPEVTRAARAVAKQLLTDQSLNLLAISDPIFHHGEMLFEAWDLAAWLADHPPVIAQPWFSSVERTVDANHAPGGRVMALKRLLTRLGLRRPAKLARKAVHRADSAGRRGLKRMIDMGLRRPVRWAWRVIRDGGGPPETLGPVPLACVARGEVACPDRLADCVEQTSRFVSMRDIETLVSFECHDAIWDWPTECYDCKLIGFFHDAVPLRINEGPHRDPGFFYRSIAKMAQRADCIVCGSKSAQSDLHTFYPHALPKTRVVHLGHDLELLAAGDVSDLSRSRNGAKRRCDRSDPEGTKRERKIAMIGEWEPRKNQSGVLRACRHIAAMRPSERITLELIGGCPDPGPTRWLEHEAARYVAVQYLGHVADDRLGEVLRSCDVFVYPSLWEGFGMPVLDAMTAGVPVVCAENSSLTEVGGAHVFYCDPYDPVSIASAVSRALSLSDDEYERWVAEARRWARQFTWANTTERLIELLHEGVAPARSASSWRPSESARPLSHVA